MSNPLFAYLILRFIMSRNRIKALLQRITKVLWKLNIYVFAYLTFVGLLLLFVYSSYPQLFTKSHFRSIIDIHTENVVNLWFNSMNITGFNNWLNCIMTLSSYNENKHIQILTLFFL